MGNVFSMDVEVNISCVWCKKIQELYYMYTEYVCWLKSVFNKKRVKKLIQLTQILILVPHN